MFNCSWLVFYISSKKGTWNICSCRTLVNLQWNSKLTGNPYVIRLVAAANRLRKVHRCRNMAEWTVEEKTRLSGEHAGDSYWNWVDVYSARLCSTCWGVFFREFNFATIKCCYQSFFSTMVCAKSGKYTAPDGKSFYSYKSAQAYSQKQGFPDVPASLALLVSMFLFLRHPTILLSKLCASHTVFWCFLRTCQS